MARFVAAQPPGFLRKAALIAVAAIVLAIAWSAVAFSQDDGTVTFTYTKGVLKPDGSLFQRRAGQTFVYSHTTSVAARVMTPGTHPTTVLRNGKTWLTLTTAADGKITISDPNGTGQPVITIPAAKAAMPIPESR